MTYKEETMDFKYGKNSIYCGESESNHQAIIQYTEVTPRVKNVTHTGVDKSLEGQGIAGQLVDKLVQRAREEGFKLQATCSYAKSKLEKTEDYKDVYKA